MAISLVTQFQPYTDEIFTTESKKSLLTNQDFSWTGAHSIKVYKIGTSEMQDYSRNPVQGFTGSRYGTIHDLDGGLEARYQIVFNSSQESETASIMGDEALLKRALYNLIQNSVIHNPKGCGISVSVVRKETGTTVMVSDDGIGVSAEKLEKLRAAAHHLESTDEGLKLRHGLGVLLVRQIVEAHHGTMEIESAPQNGYQSVLAFPGGEP